ncbi:MAG: 3-isopropylmalate dehydratase small subunit [Pseudomonadota bacterium]
MDAFTSLDAVAVPIDIVNCDTDQIIPGRFLRHLPEDGGYDRYLFHDLRFDTDGSPRPEFILNQPAYRNSRIIVADLNWGCGSSRENAVYVLVANDIRCVIAPSFGDIHFSNCMKHGVLPVRLARETCDDLRGQLHTRPGATLAVDLPSQTVTDTEGNQYGFEIAPFDKHRMLNGLDDIGLTLEYDAEFEAFERRHAEVYDWL